LFGVLGEVVEFELHLGRGVGLALRSEIGEDLVDAGSKRLSPPAAESFPVVGLGACRCMMT